MYYELYIDSVFLVNCVMDLYLLTLTGKSVGRTATRLRLCLGSLLGAGLFCALLLLPGVPFILKAILGYGGIGAGMVGLVYRLKKPGDLVKGVGYLYTYAFLLGGGIRFLSARIPLLRRSQDSVWYLLGLGYLGCQLLSYAMEKRRRKKNSHLYTVTIETGEKKIRVTALADTGNSLRDPLSTRPVCVIGQELSEQIKEIRLPERFRAIPYHSVGKANGIMNGYEVPEIRIEADTEEIVRRNVILGISDEALSGSGSYRMILHPELLEEIEERKKSVETGVQSGRKRHDIQGGNTW